MATMHYVCFTIYIVGIHALITNNPIILLNMIQDLHRWRLEKKRFPLLKDETRNVQNSQLSRTLKYRSDYQICLRVENKMVLTKWIYC